MSDLKPCPFCGGKARRVDLHDEGGNEGGSCVECVGCGASSPVHFDRCENLEDSWNRRKPSPEITSALTHLSDEGAMSWTAQTRAVYLEKSHELLKAIVGKK